MNDAASTKQHNRNNAVIREKKSSHLDNSYGFYEATDPQEGVWSKFKGAVHRKIYFFSPIVIFYPSKLF